MVSQESKVSPGQAATIQSALQLVKAELKTWEREFQMQHSHPPSKVDVQACVESKEENSQNSNRKFYTRRYNLLMQSTVPDRYPMQWSQLNCKSNERRWKEPLDLDFCEWTGSVDGQLFATQTI
ncbi:unnamed protein product [Calypogeia fissa]